MALSIVMDLLMKTGSFETDTKKAEKRLRELEKTAKDVGKAVGAAMLAAAAGAAYWVKSSIDAMDSMAKMAQQAGVTVEALSALTYAADLSGVSQQEMSAALVRLSKGMSDAANGTGEAMRGFQALGISVKNADGSLKSSDKTFAEIAQRLSQFSDGAEKTAIAVSLFGKSGAQLIPLLNSGAAGLAEMRDEAERLGIVMDTETSKAAEQFNDNLTRLKAALTGIANTAAADFLPALNAVATYLMQSREEANALSFAAKALKTIFEALAVVGANVAFVFRGVGREIGAIGAQIAALARGDIDGFRAISEAVKADGVRAREELDRFERQVLGLERVEAPAAAPARPAAPVMRPSGGGSTRADNSAAKAWEAEKRAALDAFKAYDEEMAKLAAQAQRLAQSVETPYETLRRELADLAALAPEVKKMLGPETMGRLEAAAWERYGQSIEYATEQLDEFTMQMRENVQGLLGDSLYEAAQGNFKGILRSFSDMLLKMVAQAQAANLTRAMFGDANGQGGWATGLAQAFGTWLSGGTSSGEVGPPASAAGSHAGGLNYVPHDGYMARLHKGERVLTADQNARTMPTAMGSGSRVQVNNYMGSEAQARVSQRGDGTTVIDFERRMLSAVAADTARGGVTARATAGRMGLNNGSVLNRRRG
jgi:hypothetical protein